MRQDLAIPGGPAVPLCAETEHFIKHDNQGGMHVMNIDTMRNIDPRTVDRSQLVDRRDIRIDPDASREERLRQFVRQIKIPTAIWTGKQ